MNKDNHNKNLEEFKSEIINIINDSNKTQDVRQHFKDIKTERMQRINLFLKLLIIVMLILNTYGYFTHEEIRLIEMILNILI